MKQLIIFTFFLSAIAFSFPSQAQKNAGEIDLALGVYGGGTSAALSWNRLHPVALKGKFYVGYGLRFTSYFGSDIDLVTAPADVTEGNFFTPQNEEKMDTLRLSNAQVNSLNAAIYLMYKFNDKFGLGFNIDAIGFSFGQDQTGTFIGESQGFTNIQTSASVSSFNLLLTGDYDLGSLNSEFYAYYRLNDRLALRGGLSFVFSEYTTDQALAFDNDRFRRKSLGGLLALSYKF